MCFNAEVGFVSNFCGTPVCLADPTSIRLTRSLCVVVSSQQLPHVYEKAGAFILASQKKIMLPGVWSR